MVDRRMMSNIEFVESCLLMLLLRLLCYSEFDFSVIVVHGIFATVLQMIKNESQNDILLLTIQPTQTTIVVLYCSEQCALP